MLGLNQESLRLCGINVAGGVVFGLLRNGSNEVQGQSPTNLPFTRHLTWYPDTDSGPEMRYETIASAMVGRTAKRAGRSGCFAGVLDSCRSAIFAAPAILSGWSSLERANAPEASDHVRSMVWARRGKRLSGHSHDPLTIATLHGAIQQRPCSGSTKAESWPGAMSPAAGIPGSATRGA